MGMLIREIKSLSSERTYELRIGDDGRVYCTCPSWKFQKAKNGVCKHVCSYMDELANGKPAQAVSSRVETKTSAVAPSMGIRRRVTPLERSGG